jgi:hypothetical protein
MGTIISSLDKSDDSTFVPWDVFKIVKDAPKEQQTDLYKNTYLLASLIMNKDFDSALLLLNSFEFDFDLCIKYSNGRYEGHFMTGKKLVMYEYKTNIINLALDSGSTHLKNTIIKKAITAGKFNNFQVLMRLIKQSDEYLTNFMASIDINSILELKSVKSVEIINYLSKYMRLRDNLLVEIIKKLCNDKKDDIESSDVVNNTVCLGNILLQNNPNSADIFAEYYPIDCNQFIDYDNEKHLVLNIALKNASHKLFSKIIANTNLKLINIADLLLNSIENSAIFSKIKLLFEAYIKTADRINAKMFLMRVIKMDKAKNYIDECQSLFTLVIHRKHTEFCIKEDIEDILDCAVLNKNTAMTKLIITHITQNPNN